MMNHQKREEKGRKSAKLWGRRDLFERVSVSVANPSTKECVYVGGRKDDTFYTWLILIGCEFRIMALSRFRLGRLD